MSKTESALLAFEALLGGADALPPMQRNVVTFSRVEPFTHTPESGDPVTASVGFVLFDGNGVIDEERSGPGSFEIVHTADLEILVMGKHCDAVQDAILDAVAVIVEANRTSEDWDYLDLGTPQRDFAPDETHDQGKSCILPVIFTLRSPRPF